MVRAQLNQRLKMNQRDEPPRHPHLQDRGGHLVEAARIERLERRMVRSRVR